MAMPPIPASTKFFLSFLFLVALPSLSHQQRIRLIHRDSPESPLADPTATIAEKWRRVHRRSVAYRDHFHAALEGRSNSLMPLAGEDEEAGFDQIGGEYLMEFAIGTPPVPVTAMVDVPGDFMWTQCAPCPNCQPSLAPLYDPTKSSTSTTPSCWSNECSYLPNWECENNNSCFYIKSYGNNSQTSGPFMYDVFTINGVSYDDMPFGCGVDNSFSTKLAPARVGLTGSGFALLFSFNMLYRMPYTLSHCFKMDWNNNYSSGDTNSYLRIGNDTKLNGTSMAPLTRCAASELTQYYAPKLSSVIVGSTPLNLTDDLLGGDCASVLASSTPLTFLKWPLFDLVVSKVKEYARLPELPSQPNDPWDLCFNGTLSDAVDGLLPEVNFWFSGSLSLFLEKPQIYAEVDYRRVCLLMASTDGVHMFGTFAQMNRNIAYDLRGPQNWLYLDDGQCE